MGIVSEEMSSWARFNKASRNEDNILDQIFEFQKYSDSFYDDFIFL